MKKKILVVGDSIAKGIIFDETRRRYALLKDSFFNIMHGKLKTDMECCAKLGWTVDSVCDALEKKIAAGTAPDYVVIEVGGNDCDFDWEAVAANPAFDHQPKTPIERYTGRLIETANMLNEKKIRPIFFNLPPIDASRYFKFFTRGDEEKGKRVLKWLGEVGKIYWWHDRYNSAVEYAGEITGTTVINVRRALLKTANYQECISADGIHPNETGHKLMAEETIAYVRRHRPDLLLDAI